MYPSQPIPPSPPVAEAAARVLVVDDEAVVRDFIARILELAGYVVEGVDGGEKAVARVALGGVDLVLLDVMMPGVSGLATCRALKERAGEAFLPVVLVTARSDTASRVEGLRSGADDYVAKPFDRDELLARVEAMLRIKRQHDELSARREKLERESVHDELTGLYNTRYLSDRVVEEFRRAERYHEPFACMIADVDRLARHNDAGGREAGDAVLRSVADGLRRSVRDVDVVARAGDDEFLVLLPSTHFAGSVTVAGRLWRDVVDGEAGPTGKVSLSIGVALYPSRDVRSKDGLLRGAREALAHAKAAGGNRISVFQQQGASYSPAVGAASPQPASLSSSTARARSPSPMEGSAVEPSEPPRSRP
jgi:diguanylate cyclase (GGDEF)-like protein